MLQELGVYRSKLVLNKDKQFFLHGPRSLINGNNYASRSMLLINY